ncbi:hypothetical protein [Chryseobacterium daeguense]|uniref:hypothetical protein n=1 Tax=Chryseobacterium daeguense TaxID=412438 RepID=UPI0012DCCEED|nr:hypothetical protein [Chryseobacterium daeguense]
MKNLILFLTLPVFLLYHFLQSNHLDRADQEVAVHSLKEKPQIVYLFFKIEKEKSGSEKITLEEMKITEGRLKAVQNSDENRGEAGDFIVSLTSADGKEIVKQIVEDPLNPSREVYDKEEISRVKINLQNAEFSVRYSYSSEIQMVKIEKISETGKQLIFTQKL